MIAVGSQINATFFKPNLGLRADKYAQSIMDRYNEDHDMERANKVLILITPLVLAKTIILAPSWWA